MDRNSRVGKPNNAISTFCVGGVYIIDKRMGNERRHKVHIYHQRYDRRQSNWTTSFNRRRRHIDIVI